MPLRCSTLGALGALGLPLALAACATFVVSDDWERNTTPSIFRLTFSCPDTTQDWVREGYFDAAKGHFSNQVTVAKMYGPLCTRQGRTVDQAAFERGQALGRKTYCTPEGAYWLGRGNLGPSEGPRVKTAQCSPAIGAALNTANEAGRHYKRLDTRIENAEREFEERTSSDARKAPDFSYPYDLFYEIGSMESERDRLPTYDKPDHPF